MSNVTIENMIQVADEVMDTLMDGEISHDDAKKHIHRIIHLAHKLGIEDGIDKVFKQLGKM